MKKDSGDTRIYQNTGCQAKGTGHTYAPEITGTSGKHGQNALSGEL